MRGTLFTLVAALFLALPSDVLAQGGGGDHFLSINGGYRVSSTGFRDGATVVAHAEDGRFEAGYDVTSGPAFDVSGGVFVTDAVAVGVGVSHFKRSTPISFVGSVPHPFYFDRPRPVSAQVSGLTREELAMHVHARGVAHVGRNVQLTLFGGPSYFRIKQDIVTGFTYSEAFPYDEAALQGVETAVARRWTMGFNAGGDIAVFITPRLGIGFSTQYTRATIGLASASGGTTRVRAGGVVTGAGLRLRF